MMGKRESLHDRLWANIKKAGPDDCWPWGASTNRDGYGSIGDGQRRTILTHRAAYEDVSGPIPPGLCVLHRCDNPPCCNPRHLFLGTRADNAADRSAKGRGADRRGEKHWQVKLTEKQVLAIRSANGPHRSIAAQYGIAYSTVGRIKQRKTWPHLGGD